MDHEEKEENVSDDLHVFYAPIIFLLTATNFLLCYKSYGASFLSYLRLV